MNGSSDRRVVRRGTRLPALVLALCAALLTGCAAPRLGPLAYESAPISAHAGYVLMSVTKDGGSNAWVEIKPLGGAARPLDALGRGLLEHGDDFPGDNAQTGRLLLVPAAPGHYEVINWRLLLHRRTDTDRVIGPAALPGLGFAVRAGEVVYLGNVNIDVERGGSTDLPRDFRPLLSAGVTVSNRAERDVAMFRARYARFEDIPVRESVKIHPGWDVRIRLR